MGGSPRVSISNKFPGEANTAGPGTPLPLGKAWLRWGTSLPKKIKFLLARGVGVGLREAADVGKNQDVLPQTLVERS